MTKMYCDICRKEIKSDDYARYKIKKKTWSFGESWWTNLDVHESCWNKLCEFTATLEDEYE